MWTILEAEVMNCAEPSTASGSYELDPYQTAINRPRTRALQAVLSFMANEFAASSSVHPEAITLLEASLRLTGRDGAEHRAVLAPLIGFLLHVLPDWIEANRELIFGNAAPENLGQLMIDQAIKWARPNEWSSAHDAPQEPGRAGWGSQTRLHAPRPRDGCRVMPQRGIPFGSVDSAVTRKPNRS